MRGLGSRHWKDFRIGNGVWNLAMLEVWGEGDETCFGQARANRAHSVVQPPPRVEHEHAWPVTAFGHGEIAAGGLIGAVIRELVRCTLPHLKILLVPQNRLHEGVTLEQMI